MFFDVGYTKPILTGFEGNMEKSRSGKIHGRQYGIWQYGKIHGSGGVDFLYCPNKKIREFITKLYFWSHLLFTDDLQKLLGAFWIVEVN